MYRRSGHQEYLADKRWGIGYKRFWNRRSHDYPLRLEDLKQIHPFETPYQDVVPESHNPLGYGSRTLTGAALRQPEASTLGAGAV